MIKKFSFLIGKFSMVRFVTQNPILLLFLLVQLLCNSSYCCVLSKKDNVDKQVWVKVGLVLDLGSLEGKIVESSVSMALSDFYAVNSHYKTRISFSVRDSHGDPLLALSSGVDLLQTVGVEAIIGGNSFLETKLLAELGEKAKVPVISLNSPVSLSLSKYSHLMQVTQDSASEAKGITAFLDRFGWDSVALIYEDDDDWRESMHILMYHFNEKGVRVRSNIGFTVSSSEKFMMDQLKKLKELGVTVFVGHLSERIATQLFPCAEKLGMMDEGFAWILTSRSMDSFRGNVDEFAKEAMEGVVGFKSYIPLSKELQDFTSRWRKSLLVEEDVKSEITRLSISGVWAHDMAVALARAVEVARMPKVSTTLFEELTKTRFKGLSGEFQLADKKLVSHKLEIVNLIGSGERTVGFWNSNGSFSNRRRHFSSSNNNLETIIWSGGSALSPEGRNLREKKMKKLRVLVTSSNRFPRLMKVETNKVTNITSAAGFCIDVFLASIAPFNYEVEYIPWLNGSNYNKLAIALSTQKDKYDVAVGDITITPERLRYVDFTMPFTEMGLGVVAPRERNMWVFLKPLTPALWMTSASFFVLTGIIVWLIERSENIEFQGSWSQQIGVVLWYGFSTLVYAHRERLKHNLSKFVVTIWVFAVLILAASYTATLTTMMTVRQIRFNSNKDYVGHLSGSLVANAVLNSSSLQRMGLNTSQDYARALLNNTVSHVLDEMPYLKVLLGENPSRFLMVKTQSTSNGFGIMFQKGFKLVPNISREISKLRTDGILDHMEKRWFEDHILHTTDDTSDPLSLYRFRGLFMITGISFALALAMLVIPFPWLLKQWNGLVNSAKIVFSQLHVHFRILLARITPSPLDGASQNSVRVAQRS